MSEYPEPLHIQDGDMEVRLDRPKGKWAFRSYPGRITVGWRGGEVQYMDLTPSMLQQLAEKASEIAEFVPPLPLPDIPRGSLWKHKSSAMHIDRGWTLEYVGFSELAQRHAWILHNGAVKSGAQMLAADVHDLRRTRIAEGTYVEVER